MSLEIRRKGNKNFTHIDSDFDNQYGANDITIIFEGNTIKIRSFNGRIIFKRDGYDLSEVSIYDDTASGSQENFNDINLFKQRLINLGYPFAGGTSGSGDGIPEAPNDGQQYGRQSEGWTVVTGGSSGGIPEAPNDGQQYARQSEAWSVVAGGSSAVTSVFGRNGVVTAQSGDYSMAQITNAIPTGGSANQVLRKNSATNYDYVWSDEIDTKSKLVENLSVSGTYNIDYDFDTWNLVVTGATTFTESNLPLGGTNTKAITLIVTGEFAITFPSGWTTNIVGDYDGAVRNNIVVEFIKTGDYTVQITQPD